MTRLKKNISKFLRSSVCYQRFSASTSGQTLVEILIALVLIVSSISFAIVLVFGGQKLLIDRGNAVDARLVAEEGLDAIRSIRDRDWSELTDGEHGLVFVNGEWQLSGTSTTHGLLTRKVVITSEGSNTKRIESKITWQTDPQREQKVELVTLLTDWQNTPPPTGDPGDPGGGGLSGNWENPRTLGSVDLGPGNQATGLDVLNKIVYMSAEASSASKPDFFIIDATDGENPFVVSNLNTGPSLTSIDVSGSYVYVANEDDEDQLQIIDISDINNPVLISSSTLSNGGDGLTIFYSSSTVYVGTTKSSEGPEFYIVDVTSPSSPTTLGSLEIGDDVSGIHVSDGMAYLSTPLNSSELTIVDVSLPASPSVVSTYDAPGNSEDGKSVYLVRNRLYLGRTRGGNHSDHHEFDILDVSSSTAVVSLGSMDLGIAINDLSVRDNLAFLCTSDPNEEFQVWDISDPANITLTSSFNFAQVATGVDYEDNLVYVSVRSNDALRIITSQ